MQHKWPLGLRFISFYENKVLYLISKFHFHLANVPFSYSKSSDCQFYSSTCIPPSESVCV